MWRVSRLHTIKVTAQNISKPVRLDGGLRDRDIDKEEDIRIVLMDHDTYDSHEDFGTVTYDRITFQVSGYEMDKKDFYVVTGRTRIKYNDYWYRVNDVTDYTFPRRISLIQCNAVRRLDVN